MLEEPLLADSNEIVEENKPVKFIKRTEVQINFVWLFIGLLCGLMFQVVWTSSIFMGLALLATQYTAHTALVIISAILLAKCLALNFAAYRVIDEIDVDDQDEYEAMEAQAKKEGFRVKPEIVLKDFTPWFELMIGGVFGMFFMALALQLSPMVPQ